MLLVNIKKKLKDFTLNINFKEKVEIITMLGPSGCGKSTILNSIAGILEPDEGEIALGNNIFYKASEKINIPIYKRGIGYVQQSSNLFPHLTVLQNIMYKPKDFNKLEFEELIELLGIQNILTKFPREISGGQGQRVALGRTLMTKPSLLLMDEPFSALDNIMREKLREAIVKINKKYKIPVVFVTHDLDEAYYLGGKSAVIFNGQLAQIGEVKEIFSNPKNKEIKDFIKGKDKVF